MLDASMRRRLEIIGNAVLVAAALWAQFPARAARADGLEPRPQNVLVYHQDAETRPTLGPRHAAVTMDVFLSPAGTRNLKAYNYVSTLAERHPERLRVVFHLQADAARSELAEAALEAHAQGRFAAFMDELVPYTNTRRRAPSPSRDLEGICERAGVDFRRVSAAIQDHRHWHIIDQSELFRRRHRAPQRALTLLVNGQPSSLRASEITLARLEQLYDLAYARAEEKLDAGAELEDLYHLSLIEADASIEPIRINAGLISGESQETRPSVLEDAPLIDPRAKVGGHVLGPENARITVHFYCDFSTRFKACRETRAALESVRVYFPGLVRVFFHHVFPEGLEEDERDDLLTVHAAAICAERQGAFEQFYQRVYMVPLTTRRRHRVFAPEQHLAWIFESLDLDADALSRCMQEPEVRVLVNSWAHTARDAGITTSPTVVVGERVYPGSKTSDEIIRLIEIELMPGLLERLAPSPPGTPDWLVDPAP